MAEHYLGAAEWIASWLPFENNADDVNAFFQAYMQHLNMISTKTYRALPDKPTEGEATPVNAHDWMVPLNLIALLATENTFTYVEFGHMPEFGGQLLRELRGVKLVNLDVVDNGVAVHHLSLIGMGEQTAVMQLLPAEGITLFVGVTKNIVIELMQIGAGLIPEHFTGRTQPHHFVIQAYNRAPANANTVTNYIQKELKMQSKRRRDTMDDYGPTAKRSRFL